MDSWSDYLLKVIGILLAYFGLVVNRLKKTRAKNLIPWVTAALFAGLAISLGLKGWAVYKHQAESAGAETGTNAFKGGDNKVSPSFNSEELAVKEALKETLEFEMLTIYTHPEDFVARYRERLANYWVPVDLGGIGIGQVGGAVSNLLDRGWHYGTNSALKAFECRSVHVLGDNAHVETREKWYLPMVDNTGLLVPKHKFEFYWETWYDLQRMNGRWLIQRSNSPYVERTGKKK